MTADYSKHTRSLTDRAPWVLTEARGPYSGKRNVGMGNAIGTLGLFYWAGSPANVGADYLSWNSTTSTEAATQFVMPWSATLSHLQVSLREAPGGNSARIFTVRVNGVDTELLVAVGGAVTTGSNAVAEVAAEEGDLISLEAVAVGNVAPTYVAVECRHSS